MFGRKDTPDGARFQLKEKLWSIGDDSWILDDQGEHIFKVNGKAIAAGETEGFVKTIFDGKTGALIGAHMIGAEVTEMIQGFTLAITLEATEAEVFATVFPHPTMSEAMHESALDAFGQVLHI